MKFEFDPKKSDANKTKHGIDFIEAQELWNDVDYLEIQAKTTDKTGFLVIGKIGEKYWTGIITYRNDNIRSCATRWKPLRMKADGRIWRRLAAISQNNHLILTRAITGMGNSVNWFRPPRCSIQRKGRSATPTLRLFTCATSVKNNKIANQLHVSARFPRGIDYFG